MTTDKIHMLALFPRWLWDTKQSPSRRNYVRALHARDDVCLHITGLGFPDWDNSFTAMDNVRRIMPDCQAAYCYKLGGTERGHMREFAELSKHLVTAEAFNECWPGTTTAFGGQMHPGGGTVVDECRKVGTRLVVIHHANDMDRVKAAEDYGARIVHIPHGAAPVFTEAARPWIERDGIVLTGALNRDHYPLRCRWNDLIDRGRLAGRYFQRPNNYTTSVERSDALVRDYATALGSARVKLGCSSVWKYQLQHFSEAALAGCAHVSDLSDEAPGCEQMLHAVAPNASDDELVAAVEYAMEHAQEIGERAQRTALAGFTTAHYAARLVTTIREML